MAGNPNWEDGRTWEEFAMTREQMKERLDALTEDATAVALAMPAVYGLDDAPGRAIQSLMAGVDGAAQVVWGMVSSKL